MTIAEIRCRTLRATLARPWGPDRLHQNLIVVEVTTDDGHSGTGFSWTPEIGAEAVLALLENDIAPRALGSEPTPAPVWDALAGTLREAGSSGLVPMALAGLDIALWDLRAKQSGRSLVDLLGRRRTSAPLYGSGVNRHYPLDELVEQVRRWVAAGHRAVKVKVGRPDLAEDVERIAAVRQVLGPDRLLMVDANQRWDVPAARRAIRALERFSLHWVEEPLPADDLAAYADLRARVDTPIAFGESLSSVISFRDALTRQAVDVLQPNVVRVGGITPFLRIVELAHAFTVPVAPHLLPDLSAQLALVLPLPALVEDVEDASLAALGVLAAPSGVELRESRATADTGPGHGLHFVDTLPAQPPEGH
jgi:L-alanine-DL-glutamate epimerase-like enolase superfamily enzyme